MCYTLLQYNLLAALLAYQIFKNRCELIHPRTTTATEKAAALCQLNCVHFVICMYHESMTPPTLY